MSKGFEYDQNFRTTMSTAVFRKLSEFINAYCGIKMPPEKKILLESRLNKRLRHLNMKSFDEYCNFLFSPTGKRQELIHMIDVVTTNKTDFFREAMHFDFMRDHIFTQFKESKISKANIWSAGCSSGEEVYTICMVLEELREFGSGVDYSVTGTDICSQVLEKAALAVYPEVRTMPIPLAIKRKYFLKSRNATEKTVRIIPELRGKTNFMRLNFMDESFDVPNIFDIIFCRNVLIYFDNPTQENVLKKLCSKLKVGGYLFIGHSESLTNMNLPLIQVKPTIFRKI
ncbi:CheR family methyltransferase [Sporocytophaga sp.]|uniref:CheR family methyltransferase n=1 Tax=Sporocytophaga sp. TaxID=2231183 RepID=UPI0025F31986|nr:CheR family methyltransferase [Sporocytophaga sp.]